MGGGDSHIPSEIRERQTYSVAKSFHKHLQRLVRLGSFSDCGKLTVPGNDKFPSDLSRCKKKHGGNYNCGRRTGMEDGIYAAQIGKGFGATDDKESRRGVVRGRARSETRSVEKTGGKSEIRGSWVFQSAGGDPSSLLP